MRVEDIASHHSLSFEGSEWLLREPAQKEQKSGPNGQANHGWVPATVTGGVKRMH